ncbi:hypothetical protein TNCT_403381 [Trichonephila clavata]|uniref:Uncharacterized protein n=1 Tax=Trichonephila clavata TaxID=2740835 RepID=A0A8X6HBP4_TRICU|nr:hypothetical protein TNCT_403381 [Trichonephila clavata]
MACAGLETKSTVAESKTILSLSFPKAIRMPDERSQGPPCRMEACVVKVLKYSWTVLNHCFVVDGCIFCSAKVSCCPWTGWSIVLLSREL